MRCLSASLIQQCGDTEVMLYKLCQECQGHKSGAQSLVLSEAVLSQKPGQSQTSALLRVMESSFQSWILQQWTREKWLDETSLVSDKEMKDAGLQGDVEQLMNLNLACTWHLRKLTRLLLYRTMSFSQQGWSLDPVAKTGWGLMCLEGWWIHYTTDVTSESLVIKPF